MNVSGRAKFSVSAPLLHSSPTSDLELRSTQSLQNSRATRPDGCLSLNTWLLWLKISPSAKLPVAPLFGSKITRSLAVMSYCHCLQGTHMLTIFKTQAPCQRHGNCHLVNQNVLEGFENLFSMDKQVADTAFS